MNVQLREVLNIYCGIVCVYPVFHNFTFIIRCNRLKKRWPQFGSQIAILDRVGNA
jgi:hypothetical protein